MKRFWLGTSILAALLVISALACIAMDCIHSPIADDLELAAQAATAEDWTRAEKLVHSAHSRWKKYWCLTAAMADHTPMDELDGLFGELEIYLQARELPHFAVTGKHLSELARAMADSHLPVWWNLL